MGNIIGIVCCPMIAKNILKQMSMPQDTLSYHQKQLYYTER